MAYFGLLTQPSGTLIEYNFLEKKNPGITVENSVDITVKQNASGKLKISLEIL